MKFASILASAAAKLRATIASKMEIASVKAEQLTVQPAPAAVASFGARPAMPDRAIKVTVDKGNEGNSLSLASNFYDEEPQFEPHPVNSRRRGKGSYKAGRIDERRGGRRRSEKRLALELALRGL